MLETVEKIAPLLTEYPRWFQYTIAVWFILTAALAVGMFLLYPRGNTKVVGQDIDDLNSQLNDAVQQEFEIPKRFIEQYSDVLSSPDAGITKLLADGSKLEKAVRGGGTYWSFLRRTHEYGYGSDVNLYESQFKTGFAGADFGHFLRLGKAPIRQVIDTAGGTAPNWLEESRQAAWQFLWEYQPPKDIKEIRKHQERARGFLVGNTALSESVPAVVGESYLLRSIVISDWDILVAFEVVQNFADSSLLIVWKVVKVFDTPISVGSE